MSGPNHPPEFVPPAGFTWLAETLETHGFEAWAVGGAIRDHFVDRGPVVRDALLRRERSDWDLATDARPDDVCRIFRRTVPIGIEHGTVGVLTHDAMYEVTTFRRDVETDGRHAIVAFAETIQEDLARRDFTINAVAWRPATGDLLDPFDGRSDLASRVLRAVGEPEARFAEDYLRVLRGVRFAGALSLEIESSTREALEGAVSGLEQLSAERIREELLKVLADPLPSHALRLYAEIGALEAWYPELEHVAAEAGVWERTLRSVDLIGADRELLRLARWLLPIGVDGDSRVARAEPLLKRLKLSNVDTRTILDLLRHYHPFIGPMDSAAEVRGWLAEVGRHRVRDLFRLHFSDARASANEADEAGEYMSGYLVAAWRSAHHELLGDPPLSLHDLAIGGDELMELGVPKGPLIGLLLEELHAAVLEDPGLNDSARLVARARELIEPEPLAGEAGPGDREPGGER
jgi:tRNA nucleotidyltransferase/poly(A) polymerase